MRNCHVCAIMSCASCTLLKNKKKLLASFGANPQCSLELIRVRSLM